MTTDLQFLNHVLTVTRAKEIRGEDCSEDDSAAIKRYMRSLDPETEQRMIDRLATAWPLEWAEIAEECI